VRVVSNDTSRFGLKHNAPRRDQLDIHPAETYTPEQFYTDFGLVLIVPLAMALVIHFWFIILTRL
jgi:hypothetical protein